MIERILAFAFCTVFRILTGARATWRGTQPETRARVYYANHRSHGDFILIWAILPSALRAVTRPVAAADYWLAGSFRRYLIKHVFRGLLIERHVKRGDDPIGAMYEAIEAGESLIVFPEGTRGNTALPFKPGIHHLAKKRPETEFVPIWIENLGRALPKGGIMVVPLLCTVTVGTPVTLEPGESRADFIARCQDALLALQPPE